MSNGYFRMGTVHPRVGHRCLSRNAATCSRDCADLGDMGRGKPVWPMDLLYPVFRTHQCQTEPVFRGTAHQHRICPPSHAPFDQPFSYFANQLVFPRVNIRLGLCLGLLVGTPLCGGRDWRSNRVYAVVSYDSIGLARTLGHGFARARCKTVAVDAAHTQTIKKQIIQEGGFPWILTLFFKTNLTN